MWKRIFALMLAGLVMLACAGCGAGKTAMIPAVRYQGDLYIEAGPSDKDLEGEGMTYAGDIASVVSSIDLPQEDWQGNYETLLDGKVYLSNDGILHLLLSNGSQIEMKRYFTNDPITTDTSDVSVQSGGFASARRVLSYDDLRYDAENKPIIDAGEVLVWFTYMEPFDEDVWRASTEIQHVWVAEAVDHELSQGETGQGLRKTLDDNGKNLFSNRINYGFGIAVSETWMLPAEEYDAAYAALMYAARLLEEKSFWLLPNNYSGILYPLYDSETSFRIASYLPEQLQPNAEAIGMSIQLMQEYFPFLGME